MNPTTMTPEELINDRFVLKDMKAELVKALTEAVHVCAKHALRLRALDADQVMVDLRAEFDVIPGDDGEMGGTIRDCFTDAFYRWEKLTNDHALEQCRYWTAQDRKIRPAVEAAEGE